MLISRVRVLAGFAGQSAADTPDAHVARAKTAAGDTYQNLFNFLCAVPAPRGGGPAQRGGPPGGGRAPGPPDRSTWYAEPVKVFDNLYFVGQTEYSAWAVTTSAGHHPDRHALRLLRRRRGRRRVEEARARSGDDPLRRRHPSASRPSRRREVPPGALQDARRHVRGGLGRHRSTRRHQAGRDMVATDGQTLTLGDTTITLYVTPGHTPGTLSVLIPVRDSAGWPPARAGRTSRRSGAGRDSTRTASLSRRTSDSARRFDDIARQAGADVILSNHTDWDGSKVNLPRLATRARRQRQSVRRRHAGRAQLSEGRRGMRHGPPHDRLRPLREPRRARRERTQSRRRLADLQSRSRRHALLAAHADQHAERLDARPGVVVSAAARAGPIRSGDRQTGQLVRTVSAGDADRGERRDVPAVGPSRRRPRARDREGDLALRAARRARLVPRRRVLARRRRPARAHLLHQPAKADRPARRHRRTRHLVRHRRSHRSGDPVRRRAGDLPEHRADGIELLRARRAAHRPAPHDQQGRKGRRARLRRAHRRRRSGTSTPFRGPAKPVTTRWGNDSWKDRTGQQRLVVHADRRRAARPRLPAGQRSGHELLRRRPARRQPVQQLDGGPRRADRQAEVALPEHPSRDLGLQPPARARPDRHQEGRPDHSRARAGREIRLHVHPEPRGRHPGPRRRGTPAGQGRRAGRVVSRHAADSQETRSARPGEHDEERSRHGGRHDAGTRGGVPRVVGQDAVSATTGRTRRGTTGPAAARRRSSFPA